jgi:hypothetical protein
MGQDLSKYALRKEIPYIDEKGELRYRPALAYAEMESDGTIVLDLNKAPKEAFLCPPFDVIEEETRTVYQAWIAEMDKFILHANYSIEEVADTWITVSRSDGVRFKLIGWIAKQALVDLAGYPEGVDLAEFTTLMLLRMAERHPEKFQDPDKAAVKYSGSIIMLLGLLHNEAGLVLVEKAS